VVQRERDNNAAIVLAQAVDNADQNVNIRQQAADFNAVRADVARALDHLNHLRQTVDQLQQQNNEQRNAPSELSEATKNYLREHFRRYMHQAVRAPTVEQAEQHLRALIADPELKARTPDLTDNTIQEALKKFIKHGNDIRGAWSQKARELLEAYALQHDLLTDTVAEREAVIRSLTAAQAYGIVIQVFQPDPVTEHDRHWLWTNVITAWIDGNHVQTGTKRKRQAQEPQAPPPIPDIDGLLQVYRRG